MPQPTTPLVENVPVQKTATLAKTVSIVNTALKMEELVGFVNKKHRNKNPNPPRWRERLAREHKQNR